MKLQDLIEARCRAQKAGIEPDRLEVSHADALAWEDRFCPALPIGFGSILGLTVMPGDETRIGGYRTPPKRLQIVPREWVSV